VRWRHWFKKSQIPQYNVSEGRTELYETVFRTLYPNLGIVINGEGGPEGASSINFLGSIFSDHFSKTVIGQAAP